MKSNNYGVDKYSIFNGWFEYIAGGTQSYNMEFTMPAKSISLYPNISAASGGFSTGMDKIYKNGDRVITFVNLFNNYIPQFSTNYMKYNFCHEDDCVETRSDYYWMRKAVPIVYYPSSYDLESAFYKVWNTDQYNASPTNIHPVTWAYIVIGTAGGIVLRKK